MIAAFRTGISAAQNGPVTRICPDCRALLLTSTENCSFCRRHGESVAVGRSARQIEFEVDGSDDLWRKEVTRRLGDYRARRGHFQREIIHPPAERLRTHVSSQPPARIRANRPSPSPGTTDRLDICIQPELDFYSGHDDRAHPQTALIPVAGLGTRRMAGILDTGFISLTIAGFLTLFHSLGGEIVIGKLDALVCTAVVFLFYAIYFLLFTVLNSATPGMQLCGLNTVRLDGTQPETRQLVWRSFGYVLSGVTLALGYSWSVWDEDHFTWHDRISQTYITSAAPLSETYANR
jgi:uncharacterized RDD family membrane protein YckC